MPPSDDPAKSDATRNRDDQQKPGKPPRPATEPHGERESRSDKTKTDPATGEPHRNRPDPA